ncbi:MAG: hypothetical protein LBK94_06160 [Prevotellaceae bacterium]|nr:hypothetical protein [Prevotellaceae bacterium]
MFFLLNAFFNFYHGAKFPWDTGKGRFSLEGLLTSLVLALPFLIINYIYIYREKRRKEIIEKYKRQKGKERMKSKVFFWIYVILSMVLLFYSMYKFSTRDKDGNILYEMKHKREYHFPAGSDSMRDSMQIYIPDMPPELQDAASYILWNEAELTPSSGTKIQ